jgi:hypothetical protein
MKYTLCGVSFGGLYWTGGGDLPCDRHFLCLFSSYIAADAEEIGWSQQCRAVGISTGESMS